MGADGNGDESKHSEFRHSTAISLLLKNLHDVDQFECLLLLMHSL